MLDLIATASFGFVECVICMMYEIIGKVRGGIRWCYANTDRKGKFQLTSTKGILDEMEYIQDIQVHCDYTYRHSINVAIISGILGKSIGLKKEQLEDLVLAGLLHDIGKIMINWIF